EKIVDRSAEFAGLRLAAELGIDDTFLTGDPEAGWKISRFVRDVRNLDVTRPEELKAAMEMDRALHTSGRILDRSFDFVTEGLRYEGLLKAFGPIDVPGYFELRDKVLRLKTFADTDGFDKVPSHNDFFPPNFLVDKDGKISLIDWEYAGMSDMAADFGTMVVCTPEMTRERAAAALEYYLGHAPSEAEERHFFAYEVFAGWCWYVWALVKEAEGDDVGEWLYIYYSHATRTLDSLLASYEAISASGTEDSKEGELA
ncbi:MAG: phosphotransferase, partial [Schaalia sp.]|nr:phosphotransferase [Schaalia sp.]